MGRLHARLLPERGSMSSRPDDEPTITSRYCDNPDVSLDPQQVPEPLRPLLRFAATWAILDDVERSRFIAAASRDEKKVFVDAVAPFFNEIAHYAEQHADDVPVPDEVVVLNLLAEAADTASFDVR